MRGFPGKVRQLAWSDSLVKGQPRLAASSVEGIVVWTKHANEQVGWKGESFLGHDGIVQALQFQLNTGLLVSAADDGRICIWENGKRLVDALWGVTNGFSCLSWQPQGQLLVAGGQNGELLIWSKASRGQGFKPN